MSFYTPQLHHEQQHAAFFEYSTSQGPLCLACFLHSIADTEELDSRKTFLLRCAVADSRTELPMAPSSRHMDARTAYLTLSIPPAVFVTPREFVRQFGPEGPDGPDPLRQLLNQHASTLVNGLLSACTASQDMCLSGAVQEAAVAMCCCAPEYLPELCTERWVCWHDTGAVCTLLCRCML